MGTDNSDPGNIVRYIADSCSSSSQGVHRGGWYFPDGDRVTVVSVEVMS